MLAPNSPSAIPQDSLATASFVSWSYHELAPGAFVHHVALLNRTSFGVSPVVAELDWSMWRYSRWTWLAKAKHNNAAHRRVALQTRDPLAAKAGLSERILHAATATSTRYVLRRNEARIPR